MPEVKETIAISNNLKDPVELKNVVNDICSFDLQWKILDITEDEHEMATLIELFGYPEDINNFLEYSGHVLVSRAWAQ